MTHREKQERWESRTLWVRITFLWLVLYPAALVLCLVLGPLWMPFYMAYLVWEDTKKELARSQEVQPC